MAKDIRVFVLPNGMEVIGEVVGNTARHFTVARPQAAMLDQSGGIRLVPWLSYSVIHTSGPTPQYITFNLDALPVEPVSVVKAMEDAYLQATSGLVIAGTKTA